MASRENYNTLYTFPAFVNAELTGAVTINGVGIDMQGWESILVTLTADNPSGGPFSGDATIGFEHNDVGPGSIDPWVTVPESEIVGDITAETINGPAQNNRRSYIGLKRYVRATLTGDASADMHPQGQYVLTRAHSKPTPTGA